MILGIGLILFFTHAHPDPHPEGSDFLYLDIHLDRVLESIEWRVCECSHQFL